MATGNELTQIVSNFQIPDNVLIRVLPINKIMPSPIGSPKQNYNIPDGYKGIYATDFLGNSVEDNIQFLPETYQTNIPGQFITTPSLIYYAVLLTVSQAKKIIKTEIQGRNGTIPEYVGMDDYQITINGVITAQNGLSPIMDVIALKKILDAPVAIPVASEYLNNLGIQSVIINSYELNQEAGSYSYQPFSISCSSDISQELRLTNV